MPTIAEAGLPGYEVNVWYGLFVPRGTPARMISKIAYDTNRVLKSAEIRERFAGQGVDAAETTPEEFKSYFQSDVRKWAKVVKATGVSVDR